MIRILLPAMLVTALAWNACDAIAQPADGDLVLVSVGARQGVFHTETRLLGLRTVQGTTTLWAAAVVPGFANDGMLVLTTLSRGALFRYRANATPSVVTTFATLPPRDLALDQDGTFVLPASNRIVRWDGTTATDWVNGPLGLDRIVRDGDTGDFVVTRQPQGDLLRLDRVTGLFSTIATNLGTLTGIAYNPITGRLAVARFGTRSGLLLTSSRSSSPTVVGIANAGAVAVHPWTGEHLVGTYDGRVLRVAPDGTITSTRSYGAGYAFRDIAVWGSRNLSAVATGQRAVTITIDLRFPRSSARSYCVAMSLANRPGIALPDGRTLSLAPDALFFTTVCRDLPGLTQGFLGILDRAGIATARVTVPSTIPSGIRFYIGAAAVNPSLPTSLDISNVEVVRLRT